MTQDIVFLDTETTGTIDPGLIQLSFIRVTMTDELLTPVQPQIFNRYYRTDKKISLEAMSVCHITPKVLQEKGIDLDDAEKRNIEQMLQDCYIVAHNAKFDRMVLDNNGIKTNPDMWIDTYPVAHELYQEATQHKLQYLRYYLGLEFAEEINPHDSMSDVLVLEQVFYKMYDKIYKSQKDPFEEMLALTKRGVILRSFPFGKHKGRPIADIVCDDRGWLEWLYNQERMKPQEERNEITINTLNFWLS